MTCACWRRWKAERSSRCFRGLRSEAERYGNRRIQHPAEFTRQRSSWFRSMRFGRFWPRVLDSFARFRSHGGVGYSVPHGEPPDHPRRRYYRHNVELPDTLSTCSDEDLLTYFCKGQKEAFGVLVRRYERELYGYLRRYVGDSSLADDVFQNTFLQLYVKVGQYEAGRPVRPWLYTIATHQAIDALRRNG